MTPLSKENKRLKMVDHPPLPVEHNFSTQLFLLITDEEQNHLHRFNEIRENIINNINIREEDTQNERTHLITHFDEFMIFLNNANPNFNAEADQNFRVDIIVLFAAIIHIFNPTEAALVGDFIRSLTNENALNIQAEVDGALENLRQLETEEPQEPNFTALMVITITDEEQNHLQRFNEIREDVINNVNIRPGITQDERTHFIDRFNRFIDFVSNANPMQLLTFNNGEVDEGWMKDIISLFAEVIHMFNPAASDHVENFIRSLANENNLDIEAKLDEALINLRQQATHEQTKVVSATQVGHSHNPDGKGPGKI